MLGRLAASCLCLASLLSTATAQTVLPRTTTVAPKTTMPLALEEPRDVVAKVYELARTRRKRPESPFFMSSVRATYFSKSFDLLVTTSETKAVHDGDTSLDFDPVSASQDAEIQKVILKTDLLEPGKAVVSASFSNHGQPTVVTYDFVKEDGLWKINDIKGTNEKEAWSVRKILKVGAREPKSLPGMPNAGKKPDAAQPLPPSRKQLDH